MKIIVSNRDVLPVTIGTRRPLRAPSSIVDLANFIVLYEPSLNAYPVLDTIAVPTARTVTENGPTDIVN